MERERYRQHLAVLQAQLGDALARQSASGAGCEAAIFHFGRPPGYPADDQAAPYRAYPHALRWAPLASPDSLVLARPEGRVRIIRLIPDDYWHDHAPPPASYWEDDVELLDVGSTDDALAALGEVAGCAWVGPDPALAARAGVPEGLVEPAALMAALDWNRAFKTGHELALLEAAAERGAALHAAARDAFLAGADELRVQQALVAGSGGLESELAFDSIVAFDRHAAILHYTTKRLRDGQPARALMLCDAGGTVDGYHSDITRTWLLPDAGDEARALVAGVDRLQRELVGSLRPGLPWLEVHQAAHRAVLALLVELGAVRSLEAACEAGLGRIFMPHGVGHLLGLQVHDVGGHQATIEGGRLAPPELEPYLRATRTLAEGMVFTVEPGCYFIDSLLEPLRAAPAGELLDWAVIDRLRPLGGVRIEDDVLITADGQRDLTRPLIGGC